MLVLLIDDCPIMFSNVTEFYAAGSVCTMSVYDLHLRWAGFDSAEVTLCVSCKRRELLSAVKLATLATAVSLSQLTKPAAASKDSCEERKALTVEGPDPQIIGPDLTIQDATKSHSTIIFDQPARREGVGLKSV